MALSKSPKKCKIPEVNQDLISSLPTDLTEKILKFLPLQMVARMSVLSTKWRQNWLSHSYLIFDAEFWNGQRTNGNISWQKISNISWQKISNIVSNILFHHNGPIHTFYLCIPRDVDQVISLNLSQWLSFLSRNGIKEIRLENRLFGRIPMPSHVFACKDIEKLHIKKFVLMPQPNSFEGFALLRRLELYYTKHSPDTFRRLIANCPRLTTLKVVTYSHDMLIIDVPSLKHLVVQGYIESFSFKDAPLLKRISLGLSRMTKNSLDAKITDILNFLKASSRVLQNFHLGGDLCQLMAAGGITSRFTLSFGHLHKLTLSDLHLGDSRVFHFIIAMIQSSPFIKYLKLSVSRNTSVVQHQFDYDENCKLGHLRNVEIEGFKGSTVELKLIEHLLSISVVLDKLVIIVSSDLEPSSELKVVQELLQLPRLSTKAKLMFRRQ